MPVTAQQLEQENSAYRARLATAENQIEHLQKVVEVRDKMLRQKDEAMGTLFGLLDKAGVDYSSLIS